jgi:Domain of unknown function (DUF5122) beta-propeller
MFRGFNMKYIILTLLFSISASAKFGLKINPGYVKNSIPGAIRYQGNPIKVGTNYLVYNQGESFSNGSAFNLINSSGVEQSGFTPTCAFTRYQASGFVIYPVLGGGVALTGGKILMYDVKFNSCNYSSANANKYLTVNANGTTFSAPTSLPFSNVSCGNLAATNVTDEFIVACGTTYCAEKVTATSGAYALSGGFTRQTCNGTVTSMIKNSDESIIIGGAFTLVAGATHNRIAKFASNGALDSTFNTNKGTGVDGQIVQLHKLASGSVLVFHAGTTYNGTAVSKIFKISNTGVLDNTFTTAAGTPITAFNSISRVFEKSNGNVVVMGDISVGAINYNYYEFNSTGAIVYRTSDNFLQNAFGLIPITDKKWMFGMPYGSGTPMNVLFNN